MHPDCLAMTGDEEARQWELDHPDGISAEEMESMDRYAAEACREDGCR